MVSIVLSPFEFNKFLLIFINLFKRINRYWSVPFFLGRPYCFEYQSAYVSCHTNYLWHYSKSQLIIIIAYCLVVWLIFNNINFHFFLDHVVLWLINFNGFVNSVFFWRLCLSPLCLILLNWLSLSSGLFLWFLGILLIIIMLFLVLRIFSWKILLHKRLIVMSLAHTWRLTNLSRNRIVVSWLL